MGRLRKRLCGVVPLHYVPLITDCPAERLRERGLRCGVRGVFVPKTVFNDPLIESLTDYL